MQIILFLLIGAGIGWLAGQIMRGRGFGLLGNMVLGIVGAFVGGFLFRMLNISLGGAFGSLLTALMGAIVLLFVVSVFKD